MQHRPPRRRMQGQVAGLPRFIAPPCSRAACLGRPSRRGPAPLDEEEIREAVEQLLLRRAPAAVVRLVGKGAYARYCCGEAARRAASRAAVRAGSQPPVRECGGQDGGLNATSRSTYPAACVLSAPHACVPLPLQRHARPVWHAAVPGVLLPAGLRLPGGRPCAPLPGAQVALPHAAAWRAGLSPQARLLPPLPLRTTRERVAGQPRHGLTRPGSSAARFQALGASLLPGWRRPGQPEVTRRRDIAGSA